MTPNRFMGLALSVALAGTALGCAPAVPNAASTAPAQKADTLMEGTVAPEALIQNDRQIMVGDQAMSFDQIRHQLPSRLSADEAAKLLVDIDASKIHDGNALELQQRGRGFARGGGRGFVRGFGRGFGRGFARGFGRGYGRFRYFGYRGNYFPYYNYGGYYYPYTYAYSGLNYWPYLYGYGGGYYPYSYCW